MTAHPAKFNDQVLVAIRLMLDNDIETIFDPFAGVGRIHELGKFGYKTVGIELEPEWAAMSSKTEEGNALHTRFDNESFDAIATSPAYGNRMADNYDGRDGSKRNTYRIALDRELHPDNSGGMQWGSEYREFHRTAWEETIRVLEIGGIFILNIKDHIRRGEIMPVSQWHIDTLKNLGLFHDITLNVHTAGLRYGANYDVRVDYESVVRFCK